MIRRLGTLTVHAPLAARNLPLAQLRDPHRELLAPAGAAHPQPIVPVRPRLRSAYHGEGAEVHFPDLRSACMMIEAGA